MVEGEKKTTKKSTRQRIIDTALRLFNERRYSNVTTAMLAKEVGIAEGNLWYHFNDKTALLSALEDLFAAHMEQRLTVMPGGGPALEEYLRFFATMATEIDRFRFFFRDQPDYEDRSIEIFDRVSDLYKRSLDQYRAYFHQMRDQGYIDINDERLDSSIVNIVILFRYYTEFAQETDLLERDGAPAARRAFKLHLAMFDKDFTPEAMAYFQSALQLDELPAISF